MVYHPPSIVVEIVGTDAGDRGRTCEEHPDNCGVVLEEDVVRGSTKKFTPKKFSFKCHF